MSTSPKLLDWIPGKGCPSGYRFLMSSSGQRKCLRADCDPQSPPWDIRCSGSSPSKTGASPVAIRRLSAPMIITERRERPVSSGADILTGQTARRDLSRQVAHSFKVSGGGSVATGPRQSSVGDLGTATGGALGGAIGGETGRAIGEAFGGFIAEAFDRPSKRSSPSSGGSTLTQGGSSGPCPGRLVKLGSNCVDPAAVLPGGQPAVVPQSGQMVGGGGQAVMGGFGIPAMAPLMETRIVRSCGPGMVLGRDNLCYPKSVLPRRSKYRKWRGDAKPPITAADMKAIRAAARAQDRVKALAKDVGLRPMRKKRS